MKSVVHGFATIVDDGAVPPGLEGTDLIAFLGGGLDLSVPLPG